MQINYVYSWKLSDDRSESRGDGRWQKATKPGPDLITKKKGKTYCLPDENPAVWCLMIFGT